VFCSQIEQRPRVADRGHQGLEFVQRLVVARQHVERGAVHPAAMCEAASRTVMCAAFFNR